MNIRQLQAEFRQVLARKQDAMLVEPALLGDGRGTVENPNRPGWVYIRVGNEEKPGEAFNKRVPNRNDLPVLVGYASEEPMLYQVLATREVYTDAGYDPIPQIGPHHRTHEWPVLDDPDSDGSDLVYVSWRQIMGLRVGIVSGFTVQVARAPLYRDDIGWTWVATQSIDLSASQPGTGARYVLIYLDEDGTIKTRDGAVVPSIPDIVFDDDCPAPTGGEFTLAAVLLASTQSALQDNRDRQDIVDLRFPQVFAASQANLLSGLAELESELDFALSTHAVEG